MVLEGFEIHTNKKRNNQWTTVLVSVLCETDWKTDSKQKHIRAEGLYLWHEIQETIVN
jgi:hypothetical protein